MALSFHYIHWFSKFLFCFVLFEYHQILIPIPSFTNKGIHILVRIKGRTEAGEFIAWVCYSPSDQEDQGNEAPYTERHNLMLPRPGPRGTPATPSSFEGTTQQDTGNPGDSQNVLISTFFSKFQRIHHGKAMLDLLLNKEGLVANMKKKNSLGCCDN